MNIDLHVAPGLTALISRALILNASDIYVTTLDGNVEVSVRVDGDTKLLCEQVPHERRDIIKEIKGVILGNESISDGEAAAAIFHFAAEGEERVRVRLSHQPFGIGVMILMRILRLSPDAVRVPLAELGYTEEQIRAIKNHQGASDVVMSGRVGVLRFE